MRKLVWALVLGFVLSSPVLSFPAWAGVGVWTPVGGVQPFSRLVADPGDPRTFYALAWLREPDDSYALWRSTDGGETWRSIQEGIGPVKLLAADPLQTRQIYAWTVSVSWQTKLWVSEDRGDTWTLRYAAELNSNGPSFRIRQILASPVREGVLYAWGDSPTAFAGADLYRSTDGGATWTLRSTVGTRSGSTEPLLHHPTRKRLEYFDSEGFYTSNDDGLTWTKRSTYRGQGFYSSMARSAAAPDRLYAIPAEGCLVRSDDGGTHWKKTRSLPALPPGVGVSCRNVSVDPADPDHLVLMADGEWRRNDVNLFSISRDGGATWSEPRSFPGTFVRATGDGSGTLFAAGDSRYPQDGPFRSTDDGLTWTPSWKGIAFGDFRDGLVALPSAGPVPVLVATVDGRILRSEDGGATWETVALPYGYGHQRVVADADGRTLYVLWRDESRGRTLMLKSTDSGLTWAEVSKVPSTFGVLFADPFHPGRLFARDDDEDYGRIRVWRSIDGGKSWARRSAGLPIDCEHFGSVDYCPGFYAMTSDPRDPKRVVISYGGHFTDQPGIFVSTDGGTRWRRAAQGPPGLSFVLAADPAATGIFLAGTRHGIYRSVDGGDHWTPLQPGLPVAAPVLQLLRDGRNGAWYAVTDSQGTFRSTDGGTTWTGISDGLADLARPVIVLDPQTPDRLFAAVNGQGVWSWSEDPRLTVYTDNPHCRQLTGSCWSLVTSETLLPTAYRAIDEMHWFYVCEQAGLSQRWADHAFSGRLPAIARRNVTTGPTGDFILLEDLDSRTRAIVDQRTRLDRLLYEHAVRRLLAFSFT